MDNSRKREWHIGLFFNLGLGLALTTLFLFGGPSFFFSRKLHYFFSAPNAQGLIRGGKVLVAGITAGSVVQTSVDAKNAAVRVDIEVNPKFISSIRDDSYVSLATQGVLGDKVVMIQPGSPEHPELATNAELPTRPSPSLQQLLVEGDVFLQHLDQLTVGVNQWLNGLGSTDNSKHIGLSAAQTLRNLSLLTERLSHLNIEGVNSSITSLSSILGKIDHGNGALGGLINDPELYDDVKKLIGESNENRIIRNVVRRSIKQSEKRPRD